MRCVAFIECAWRDPVEALAAFADEPFAAGLISGAGGERGRWSYVARRPSAVLTLGADDPRPPLAALKELIGALAPGDPAGPPFQGGLIGIGAYEMAARFEALDLARAPDWPDLTCGLYPAVLAFDHQARRVTAVGRGQTPEQASAQAETAAGWTEAPPPADAAGRLTGPVSDEPAGAYQAAVADVVERIRAGEIFQANIARAWRGRLNPGRAPFDLVRRMQASSPAPFAAYYRLPAFAIASNSPERFLQVRPEAGGFAVEARPIKGTRPRGADAVEDARLAAELSASAKDRAENLMIVDLMRNDLSRVSDRVETRELFGRETFTNVHHLVSSVVARLRPGLSGLDAWAAAFPPGSITGAPKIQAMKVIAGLETPRGPYCGSMFWAGFDGALDSSVLIRTALFAADADGWRVEARAGAGIVADSDPREEALETEAKIAAILGALTGEGR